jgi:hypothetical protein
VDRKVITRALADALILRQEMTKHDISEEERVHLMAAAMPAFVTWEAALQDNYAALGGDPADLDG